MRNVTLEWKCYLTLLGESTPTFGEARPTSSVLSLLCVPPIVHNQGMGRNGWGRGLVVTQQKLLNHDTEAGNISLTEEARGDTDRMGVADDRESEESQ